VSGVCLLFVHAISQNKEFAKNLKGPKKQNTNTAVQHQQQRLVQQPHQESIAVHNQSAARCVTSYKIAY
jgi:hypothetical protein